MHAFIKKLPRYLLGFIYLASGIVGLLNLVPPPADMPLKLKAFMDGMMSSVYFFPFLKTTEIIFGLCLLARFIPAIALVVLAPVTLNILLVHLFLTPGLSNQVVPVVMLVLHVFAFIEYKEKFFPLLKRD